MSPSTRLSALGPFRVRSFCFQWPADLATSWAFEMETLILGWYVLVETRSVFMLTVFASLLYIGTLLSPMFGVMGDRVGHRNVLCAMRGVYATLAAILMVLSFTDLLTPAYVLFSASIFGLVRPSDIGMRTAVVGDIMPAPQLMAAMGIQRTTQDSARIAGALSGAGLVATLGMGPAYLAVAALYVTSVLLTLKAGSARPVDPALASPKPAERTVARASPWRELKEGLVYVWNTPLLLAVMCLAFLLNLTAFPLSSNLLPYVAKEIYLADQTVLGYMVAGAASGALITSLAVSRYGGTMQAARVMLLSCVVWYAMLLSFAHTTHPAPGIAALFLAGCAQSVSQVPMATLLLRLSEVKYRGRIMGIRMLAIYGNLPGLLISGPLIALFGYPATATFYCMIGIVFTLVIGYRWRTQLWRRDAPANQR
ncbi:MAG: MFS transporter [Betaproteobacteria bacterium]